MDNQRLYKKTIGTKAFDVFNIVLLLLFSFTILFPFWNQLCLSFSDMRTYAASEVVWLPLGFNFDSYLKVFTDARIGRAAIVSILRVLIGSITTLFCTGLLAYITTIKWFSGHNLIRRLFVFTMYFSGGLIPTYLAYMKIGLFNNFWVYIIPSLFSAYYMLIISSYISNLPDALFEAARIDGAGEMKIYLKVVLPVCIPVFAAVSVYTAVGQWNSWFDTTIYVPSGKWDTLQVYLRRVLLEVEALSMVEDEMMALDRFRTLSPQSLRAATTIMVTLPIVVIYPFMQKYFISGMTIGAVKG